MASASGNELKFILQIGSSSRCRTEHLRPVTVHEDYNDGDLTMLRVLSPGFQSLDESGSWSLSPSLCASYIVYAAGSTV